MTQRRDDMSMGNERTFDNKVERTAKNCSLGDQSTFGGQPDSPLGPLDSGEFLIDDDMEIVDLSKRYRIERVIGQGGMGQVLLATDTRLERKVAIKRILGDAARSKSALQRFLTEAKSIAALSHPNIVQVYDYGRAADGPFLIMEYVDGASLLDRCRDGALPLDQSIDLACQLCDGLAKAHEAGIVHRDIKPANILITQDGHPKLTDFGLAKAEAADTGMTMAGAVLGTLDFMPPEQRRDAALVDARSDLWSLAATFYQMITGKSPKIIKFSDVPMALQEVLGKALEDKKEDRYQSARDFKTALRTAAMATDPKQKTSLIDPGAGECPVCHTANEAHRKFCRECGQSLRCACLKCAHEIPLWDKVCPECGGRQADLLAERMTALDRQRDQAELLRSQFDYASAIGLAQQMAGLSDARFSGHREWAGSFLNATETERDHGIAQAQAHFEEAKRHRAAFDYEAAIKALKAIVHPLRTQEQSAFLARLESEQSESTDLLNTIKVRIENRELNELLSLAERALKLRGDREDLKKLVAQLKEREQKQSRDRDAAFQRAESLLSAGNADEALKTVRPIPSNRLTPAQAKLFKKLEQIGLAEVKLRAMVEQAKSDGVVDEAGIVALLPAVIEFTKLNPNHRGFVQLRDDLLARAGSVPVELLLSLPQSCIDQLPESLRDSLSVLTNSIGMKLRPITPGTFAMGESNAKHRVTLSKPFHMGVYPVTQSEYKRVTCRNPSRFQEAQNPVEEVSWDEAVEFCRKLSALPEEKAAGRVYRLPTEAEWEYTCRAGTTTEYSLGDDESLLAEYAWYGKNSGDTAHPVGQKKPNPWGLYDMHGNVWEWCSDWYGDYPKNAVTDPTGPPSGSLRVYRGGSWFDWAANCRSGARSRYDPSIRNGSLGFRVAMSFPSGIPK